MMKIIKLCLALVLSFALSAQADGHKKDQKTESEEGVLNLQQIAQAFDWDLDNVEICIGDYSSRFVSVGFRKSRDTSDNS